MKKLRLSFTIFEHLSRLRLHALRLIRALPQHMNLADLAAGLKKFDIGGLLVVGGFEVNPVTSTVLLLSSILPFSFLLPEGND